MENSSLIGISSLVKYQGVFRRKLTMWQGVALMVSATIGAGVLGIPYAISRVGLYIGLGYIIFLGILMIGLNLIIGEIVVRTKANLHLVGLAKRYLGRIGAVVMSILVYISVIGTMLIYIIGVGKTLFALLGGSAQMWSVIFFLIGSAIIFIGLRTVKVIDVFLSLGILAVILIIAFFSTPHIELLNLNYLNWASILLPYGVVLFALNGSSAIAETHCLLAHKNKEFKKAIIISGLIVIVAYALFTIAVIGVTGENTTEIATLGLSNQLGKAMFLFGNLFALFAMGNSFLIMGLTTKDSLMWDFKLKPLLSTILVCGLPFLFFLLGLRQFIMAIDIVGGVFISLQTILILLIYWRSRHWGDQRPNKYHLHHVLLLAVLLLLAMTFGAVISLAKYF